MAASTGCCSAGFSESTSRSERRPEGKSARQLPSRYPWRQSQVVKLRSARPCWWMVYGHSPPVDRRRSVASWGRCCSCR